MLMEALSARRLPARHDTSDNDDEKQLAGDRLHDRDALRERPHRDEIAVTGRGQRCEGEKQPTRQGVLVFVAEQRLRTAMGDRSRR